MPSLLEDIQNTASGYVSPSLINEFVKQIRSREIDEETSFFQMRQADDEVVLEFGGLKNQLLFDFTYSRERRQIAYFPIDHLDFIRFTAHSDTTVLELYSGRYHIQYKTSTKGRRKALRTFAVHIERAIEARGGRQ